MAKIDTRINENKKIEFFVYDIGNDLDALMDVIDKLREDYPLDEEKIFITEDLEFFRETMDRDINFSNCVFEKIIYFTEITFNGKVDFRNSVFQEGVLFSKDIFQKHISFPKVVFQKYISFDYIEFIKGADLSNTSFQNIALFNEVNFQGTISFINANFECEVWFSKVKSKKNIIFWNTKFQDKAKFQTCKFYNSTFENAIFNRLVDFSSSTFQSPQTFYSVSFMDKASFSNVVFEQESKFTGCKVDSKTLISFQCATFKKGLDISTSNFNLCKLNFFGIRIENIDEALSSEFYNNKRDNTKPFLSIHQRLRETFRFIKNSLYAENNQIEGLQFHKKEMEVYGKELEGKGNEYWQDKIMLWLNKKSNNYGTSWLRGIGFTAVWALGILGIILGITTLENSGIIFNLCDAEAWQQTIKAYIEIINIAKWTDIKPMGCELSGFGLFFLFIGRIFIGYGYYQTIQAFRKYGK